MDVPKSSIEDLALTPHLLPHAGFNRRFQVVPLSSLAFLTY